MSAAADFFELDDERRRLAVIQVATRLAAGLSVDGARHFERELERSDRPDAVLAFRWLRE